MFKSFNEPIKRKVVNYLFEPPFHPYTANPVIIWESGISIEIIYYQVKNYSQALSILINKIGESYNIPEIMTSHFYPNTVIGRICFNYDEEPSLIFHTNAKVTNFNNSIPLIPANQQTIYQNFDRLLVYVTNAADNWAFLLRIIKERP